VLPVLAETAYPDSAPGARVRLGDFVPFLADCGVGLSVRPNLTNREYAVVISPGSPAGKARVLGAGAARLIRDHRIEDGQVSMIHRLRSLLPLPGIDPPRHLDVYDFDDALFVGSTMEENRRFAWLKREAERWHSYTKKAKLVLAGSRYLADRASEHSSRVEVVPSCVDPSIQPLRIHGDVERVRIGWIGSQSTAVYLNQLLPVFEKLNARGRKFELVTVGAGDQLPAEWAESHPWTRESEKGFLASFDIGVMPLPDDPWTRGKCGYKLLQYFSAGVPAIASPVGANLEILGPERGRFASTEAEWLEALETLILDSAIRREMGANARSFVEENYSYQRWAPRLAEMLRSI